MRTSLVVGFAVVAQSPALLVCVLGGAIEGDDSYCDSYQDDQVYTAESCGSYDSTACMGQCTSDAGSWCNSLCGTGTETCMDGSGAVCAISALANIVDTCSTVRSATTAAVESTEELVYGGQKGIATSGSVANSVSDSDGAPETTETTTGSMEGANVHLQSCGKGCTETKYDDDVDPTSTFANGAVASSANGGLEPGRRARRLSDSDGAPETTETTTGSMEGANVHLQSCGKGCTETKYDDDVDPTSTFANGAVASSANGGLEPGRRARRLGADKLGAPNYDSSDRSSDVTTDDRFEQNGQVVVNAHGCDEHVYCVFCDATCEKVMNHYAKKLWGVQEWGKAYNRVSKPHQPTQHPSIHPARPRPCPCFHPRPSPCPSPCPSPRPHHYPRPHNHPSLIPDGFGPDGHVVAE